MNRRWMSVLAAGGMGAMGAIAGCHDAMPADGPASTNGTMGARPGTPQTDTQETWLDPTARPIDPSLIPPPSADSATTTNRKKPSLPNAPAGDVGAADNGLRDPANPGAIHVGPATDSPQRVK